MVGDGAVASKALMPVVADHWKFNNDSTTVHMPFKRHKIFASGVHKKDNPAQAVWTSDRVQGMYESSKVNSPAMIPYTFRHPENSLPVLGYADRDSLTVFEEGGRTYLSVVPKEMAKEFLGGLKATGFDKVSIGLGQKGEIVHIGFTDNPAVAGLGAAFEASKMVPPVYLEEVEFEAGDLGHELRSAFEVSWKWQLQSWMDDVASLFQKIREQKIETDGIDVADKFLPSYVLDYLKRPLPDDHNGNENDVITPTYEGDTPMTAEERARMERLEAENRTLLDQAAAEQKRKRGEAVEQFCADHAAIVTPAIKPAVVAILTALQGIDGNLTFEADGKPVEKSPFEAMCDLIGGAKPAVVFEAVATNDNGPAGDGNPSADQVQEALAAQFEAAKAK
jgi:hypothetical protein